LDLSVGSEVDEEKIGSIVGTEERLKAKNYALNLLSYRMRSKGELKTRMARKHFPKDVVEEVIQDMEEVGLVDDLEFAKSWIRTRMAVNPRSFFALKGELYKKGIDGDILDMALRELQGDYDERSIALSIARKRLDALGGVDSREARRRVMGFLSRRGFSYEVAKWAIARLEEE
jgi:regulatory protein